MKRFALMVVCGVMCCAAQAQAKGGHYSSGSSHKGAHYKNAATGNHYSHR